MSVSKNTPSLTIGQPSSKKEAFPAEWLLYGFVLAKLLVHLFTSTNYNFHRDEYLYLDQGNHLAWGYMEVPPMIACWAAMVNSMGADLMLVRLLPALIGCGSIYLIGRIVLQLGGQHWAVCFACLAFLMSPAIMRSNSLFQPVSFNQFFWLLTAYWLVQLSRKEKPSYWWALGITAGLGILTKYSIVFYFLALLVGILLTSKRKWLTSRYPYSALLIASIIAFPNLWWQYEHNFPVMAHMEELRSSQLVHVDPAGFLLEQFFFYLGGILVWGAGLYYLFTKKEAAAYRFLGWGSVVVILIILLLSGKSYYTIGAYSILLPFGGLFWEQRLKRGAGRWTLAAYLFINVLPFLPISLPLLPNAQMEKYCQVLIDKIGLTAPMRWEDGEIYRLPQDYADMNGWEELVADMAKHYQALSPEQQSQCIIYGGSYGHAGAINYHGEAYGLDEKAVSLSSSYMIWAPREVEFEMMLIADDRRPGASEWFEETILLDSIEHPYARDPGYIYLRKTLRANISSVWLEMVQEAKAPYNFE